MHLYEHGVLQREFVPASATRRGRLEGELRFHDPVHYLAAAAILDRDPDGGSVRSDIGRTIDRVIPGRF
jgi:hypothetical protein